MFSEMISSAINGQVALAGIAPRHLEKPQSVLVAEAYAGSFDLPDDDIYSILLPVVEAVESLPYRGELDIPDLAARHVGRSAYELAKQLEVSSPTTLAQCSILKVSGFNRRDMNGNLSSVSEGAHAVVAFTATTGDVLVADPLMAMFAPVPHRDLPAWRQLPSGITPFCDIPYLATADNYVSGYWMSWDEAELVEYRQSLAA